MFVFRTSLNFFVVRMLLWYSLFMLYAEMGYQLTDAYHKQYYPREYAQRLRRKEYLELERRVNAMTESEAEAELEAIELEKQFEKGIVLNCLRSAEMEITKDDFEKAFLELAFTCVDSYNKYMGTNHDLHYETPELSSLLLKWSKIQFEDLESDKNVFIQYVPEPDFEFDIELVDFSFQLVPDVFGNSTVVEPLDVAQVLLNTSPLF